MVNKKAQMKIQQMAFMLIAVTLFFAFAGMFVLGIKLSELKSTAASLNEENAMLLVSKLANSPEFSCGESFGTSRISCIDEDKVIGLKENIAKYSNFWGVENIEIRKIYPESSLAKECTPQNYPNCNIIKIRLQNASGFEASNFVALCRKELIKNEVEDKCELAKLIVSYNETV